MNGGKMNEKQKDFLISFLEANPKLAKNHLDPTFTREMANNKWKEATQRLNSLGGALKTVKQWKRTWTDLKAATKRKAAHQKKQFCKTGGGPLSSEDDDGDDDDLPPASGMVEENDVDISTIPPSDRILSLIGKTAIEGIRGIRELGIIVAESEEEDEPLPKRAKLESGGANQTPNNRPFSKKKAVGDWVDNSRKKVEAMQSIASALNNIANQIGRLADTFEEYNNANLV